MFFTSLASRLNEALNVSKVRTSPRAAAAGWPDLPDISANSVDYHKPVFLSYRWSDGKIRADQLCRYLRAAGIPVFRDRDDAPGGKPETMLDNQLAGGLSGGILLATPDIGNSRIVGRQELPQLIRLAKQNDFILSVANELPPAKNDQPNIGLLSEVFAETISRYGTIDAQQYYTLDHDQLLLLIKEQLRSRFDQYLINQQPEQVDPLRIEVQTRERPSSTRLGHADLYVRLEQSAKTNIISRDAMLAFQQTLPIISHFAFNFGVTTITFSGGFHPSVALTLGSMAVAPRFTAIQLKETAQAANNPEGRLWSSRDIPIMPIRVEDVTEAEAAAPHTDLIIEYPLTKDDSGVSGNPANQAEPAPEEVIRVKRIYENRSADVPGAAIAVLVALTGNYDRKAFEQLVGGRPNFFKAAFVIDRNSHRFIDTSCGGIIAKALGTFIKRMTAEYQTIALHLCYSGPSAIGVFLGTQLNTLSVTVYDITCDPTDEPLYLPVVKLRAGITNPPIYDVLLPSEN